MTSDSTTDPNNSTPVTHAYSYDALNQLTTVNDGTTSPSYTQTPGGSITQNTAGATLGYNPAEGLTSITPGSGPSTSYSYDGNGDRVSSTVAATETADASTTSFTYDPAANLASVGIPATGSTPATTVSYTSDGDGLRQSRTVGATTKDFLWDTNASVPLLLDDGTNSYLYGPSTAPIAQINDSTGTVRYLTSDLIGSTRLITTSTGTVVGVNLYDEYGNIEQQTGTATSAIGYSGNWTDLTTALVYLRARDYDPATAQFLTMDPLIDQTRQAYAYAADDPLDAADNSGLSADLLSSITAEIGTIGAVIAAPYNAYKATGDGDWQAANMAYNPIDSMLETYSSSRAAGNGVWQSIIESANPLYSAIDGFYNAGQDIANHCSSYDITSNVLEGVAGTAGTAGLAFGLSRLAGGYDGLGVGAGAGAAAGAPTLGDLFSGGKVPTASNLVEYAVDQGWDESVQGSGPVKFTDSNGVVRMTLKSGSARTPGSENPHVELRDASGQRVDPEGNAVTRKSLSNHSPIVWNLP